MYFGPPAAVVRELLPKLQAGGWLVSYMPLARSACGLCLFLLALVVRSTAEVPQTFVDRPDRWRAHWYYFLRCWSPVPQRTVIDPTPHAGRKRNEMFPLRLRNCRVIRADDRPLPTRTDEYFREIPDDPAARAEALSCTRTRIMMLTRRPA